MLVAFAAASCSTTKKIDNLCRYSSAFGGPDKRQNYSIFERLKKEPENAKSLRAAIIQFYKYAPMSDERTEVWYASDDGPIIYCTYQGFQGEECGRDYHWFLLSNDTQDTKILSQGANKVCTG